MSQRKELLLFDLLQLLEQREGKWCKLGPCLKATKSIGTQQCFLQLQHYCTLYKALQLLYHAWNASQFSRIIDTARSTCCFFSISVVSCAYSWVTKNLYHLTTTLGQWSRFVAQWKTSSYSGYKIHHWNTATYWHSAHRAYRRLSYIEHSRKDCQQFLKVVL